MQNKKNPGVVCNVSSCKFNAMSSICEVEQIKVTSDIADKHFCHSFKQK